MTQAALDLILQDPLRARRELDPRYCAANHVWIYDLEGKKVPFVFNEPQEIVYGEIIDDWKVGRPPRKVVLKARREGISYLVMWLTLHTILYTPGADAMIESHDLDSANSLFDKLLMMYNNFDAPEKPAAPRQSGGVLSFGHPHGGSITVASGRKKESGRSFHLKVFHGSEVAFWAQPEKVMLGVNQAVPETDPYSMIILESTANGIGGYFYDRYQAAKKGKAGDWKAIFLPWWIFKKYQRDAQSEGFSAAKLSDREAAIMETHQLSLDQMAWYHWALENKCDGDESKRAQEYPSDDEEAFLASGTCRFKATTLARLPISPHYIEGILTFEKHPNGQFLKSKFVRSPGGYLRVWERPQAETPYVGGFDVSEAQGQDDCAGVIVNASTGMQAAEIVGQFEPDEEWATLIYLLGMMYNRAFIGVEINGPGVATINRLLQFQYPTHRLGDHYEFVGGAGRPAAKRYGWRTTAISRELGIARLASALDEDVIGVRSDHSASQLKTFVRHVSDRGGGNIVKYSAQNGRKDDLVSSWWIAAALLCDRRANFVEKTHVDEDARNVVKLPARRVKWSSYR